MTVRRRIRRVVRDDFFFMRCGFVIGLIALAAQLAGFFG